MWSDCADMNEARGAVRVAALDRWLYAVGGRSETDAALSSVEQFDPVANSWKFVKSMHTARVGAGASRARVLSRVRVRESARETDTESIVGLGTRARERRGRMLVDGGTRTRGPSS